MHRYSTLRNRQAAECRNSAHWSADLLPAALFAGELCAGETVQADALLRGNLADAGQRLWGEPANHESEGSSAHSQRYSPSGDGIGVVFYAQWFLLHQFVDCQEHLSDLIGLILVAYSGKRAGSSFQGLKTAAPLWATSATFRVAR